MINAELLRNSWCWFNCCSLLLTLFLLWSVSDLLRHHWVGKCMLDYWKIWSDGEHDSKRTLKHRKKKCLTKGTLCSKKESALEDSLPRKTGGLGFRCLPLRKKNWYWCVNGKNGGFSNSTGEWFDMKVLKIENVVGLNFQEFCFVRLEFLKCVRRIGVESSRIYLRNYFTLSRLMDVA